MVLSHLAPGPLSLGQEYAETSIVSRTGQGVKGGQCGWCLKV